PVLDGKISIVTGASSGIGRAAAVLFAKEGDRLVINARRRAELDAVAQEARGHGAEVVAVPGDVGDEGLAEQLVRTATETFGGLDIAFNNAGITGEGAPLPDISSSTWHEVLATN